MVKFVALATTLARKSSLHRTNPPPTSPLPILHTQLTTPSHPTVALTALAAPSPQSCGGTAIPGSDCGFNDQCRSCRCVNGICARSNLLQARDVLMEARDNLLEARQCGGTAIPGSDCSFNDQCRSCRCRNFICA